MDSAAGDIVNGHCCALCSSYFESEHGYPVVCSDCWRGLDGNQKKVHQLATEDLLTDEDAPGLPLATPKQDANRLIAGLDEVGMGAVAGPATVAVVVIGEGVVTGVRDSKKCSRDTRWVLAGQIRQRAKFIHIAERTNVQIDQMTLLKAWESAMVECRDAVQKAFPGIEMIADGAPHDTDLSRLRDVRFVTKGDDTIYAVGAASIVAKNFRDEQMLQYAKQYPNYRFDQHVGYGTPDHWARIKKYGPCPIHRKVVADHKFTDEKVAAAPFDLGQALQIMGEMLNFLERPWLGEWERKFLVDIRKQLQTRQWLSEKQMYYLISTAGRVKKEAQRRKDV